MIWAPLPARSLRRFIVGCYEISDNALAHFGKAGIAALRLHDLRHTYASMSLARGEDYRRRSEQTWHTSYVITLDVYAHLIPADDDAASVLDLRPTIRIAAPRGSRR